MDDKNVLLAEFQTPHSVVPFDRITFEDFQPAFEKSIEEARLEIDKIIGNQEAPGFVNTVEALEYSGKKLDRVSSIFFNLNEANTSEEMQLLAQEISPMLTEFVNDIYLNEKLFAKVKSVYEKKESLGLNSEQRMLLDKQYKNFVRSGANLSDENKEKFRKITTELSLLTLKFGDNVLTETNAFELQITDEKDLAGLPAHIVETAAQAAKAKNKEGWIFTLHYPSYVPFMQYAENQDLREKMYKAFNSKAYHGNDNDNREIIKKIVLHRLQLANLLGYKTYADYVLENRMAETPEKVEKFLNEMIEASMPFAKQDYEEVQQFAQKTEPGIQLQRWDWAFYSEKLKMQKFNIDDEMTRPYFRLENVQKGIFELANMLYGITFKENEAIPTYHKDVKAYEVFDDDGRFLAVLYLDFFPRESKQGGAWATSFINQHRENGVDIRPQVSLVFNFTKPSETRPSLLTYDQVTTFLHEFGHSLHYILTDCTYGSLSGTNVYWDFVELPSQIMENWAQQREWLDRVAVHYETGEKIPDSLLNNIVTSSNFQSGYSFIRQLSLGLNDMAWHSITTEVEIPVQDFEKKAIASIELFPVVEGCMLSTQFSHIFSGGYGAGYYSYKWAEVLDADAFSVFKQNGIFDRATAQSFRENILSKGGTAHPMELYKKFRGQEPSIEPLLERSGLIKQSE